MPSMSNKSYKKSAEGMRNAFSGKKSDKKEEEKPAEETKDDEKSKDDDKESFASRVTKGLQYLKKKGPPAAKEK